MPKFRGLLIGAVLLAVLGGLVWWSNRAEKAKEGKPSPDAPPVLLNIPSDQVQQVAIKRKDGQGVTIKKGGDGKWQMVEPQPLPVDQDAVSSLTSTVSNLNSDRLIEEQAADLNAYGLASPGVEVVVTRKDGKTSKLLIGDETPTGGGFFVKLDGEAKVYTLASYNKTSLDKNYKDLRDKRLLRFDSDKVARIELNARNEVIEFGKNALNDWQILKPKPYRADGSQVEELLRRLRDAKMDLSISDEDAKKAAAGFGGATRVAVVKVTDAAGTQEMDIRKDKDNNHFVRSTSVEGIYKVASDVADSAAKPLADYRNKKVFDFGWSDPTKVEVREGAKVLALEKSGDKWMSGGKQMESVSVQTLIDRIRDLNATTFLEKPFGQPAVELTVTSNDGKRVEKVQVLKEGDKALAKRENEPTVYQMEARMLDDLQKAVGEVKEAQPAKKDEKKK